MGDFGGGASATSASSGAAKNLITQANKTMTPVISGLQSDRATAQAQAGQTFNEALSGYQQQQTTGGYDPTQLAALRSQLGQWAPTGGYDPTQLSNILGGYGALAQTGGYTTQDLNQMVNQATSGVSTTAGNLAAAAGRNAAATGGNAQAAIANIQGELGAQQADASTQARLGVKQAQIANKLQGLGGLGTTEQNVAAAMQGVAGLQTGLEGGVARGVQGANAGISGLYDTATGQVTALGNQILQGLGLQFGTEAQGAQILQELSKNPGLFQTAFGDFTSFLSSLP